MNHAFAGMAPCDITRPDPSTALRPQLAGVTVTVAVELFVTVTITLWAGSTLKRIETFTVEASGAILPHPAGSGEPGPVGGKVLVGGFEPEVVVAVVVVVAPMISGPVVVVLDAVTTRPVVVRVEQAPTANTSTRKVPRDLTALRRSR